MQNNVVFTINRNMTALSSACQLCLHVPTVTIHRHLLQLQQKCVFTLRGNAGVRRGKHQVSCSALLAFEPNPWPLSMHSGLLIFAAIAMQPTAGLQSILPEPCDCCVPHACVLSVFGCVCMHWAGTRHKPSSLPSTSAFCTKQLQTPVDA